MSGTAIEHSLAGTFKFSVIKKPTVLPWAEDDDKYIIMGIDHDLDRAMRIATYQTLVGAGLAGRVAATPPGRGLSP